MDKPRCMLTVDVEALPNRAASDHVNTLIYGRAGGREYGIGRMMDIADKHHVKMTFFVDFAECELYGNEIIEVGRYVVSRGHDLQVHCHYDLLENVVGKKPWVNINENYYSWYKNDEDSKIMVDYVTEKYIKCAGKMPVAFRGGEYRFGISVLKALRDKGYKADLSYNCLRPEILPVNKQFLFENGLIELPIGILPNKKPLNFNYKALVPETCDDFEKIIMEYHELFNEYYGYYGKDAVATILMHSWSFLHSARRFSSSGFMDEPNDMLMSFFDFFLESFKDKVEFISVAETVEQLQYDEIKKVDFQSVFCADSSLARKNLMRIEDFIGEKADGRRIIIWGKGWMESTVFQTVNLHQRLDIACYISNDADICPKWRGKPVYKYSDITILPKKDFIFVLAQSTFTEIRDALQKSGFREFEDYYDIQKKVPQIQTNGVKAELEHSCPICGGNVFETYNSCNPRRCSGCGSVERTRTMPKLLDENIAADFSEIKVLHVSPTKPERLFFHNIGADATTIDIRPECRTDIVADICNMPEVTSDSFDMVLANCVLNHVYDDEKALSEIKRVLRPGGIALLWVLDSGTLKTVADEDPTGWYGKENYDKYKIGTFRHYGEVDFTEQLCRYFPEVRCFEKYDAVTDSSCKWYQCLKE